MTRIIAAAAGAALALAARAADPFELLSLDEVDAMRAAADVALYDVNPADVYQKNHLPGSRLVSGELAALLPGDKSVRLVFYCANPH